MAEKKIKEAAALRYDPENSSAPEIIALGRGETAERIIEKARENEVPVYEDSELAHTLNFMRIGDVIPPELYEVVAKILVFISDVDEKFEGAKP
jgi:flagellar biosynthesis protein